MQKFTGEFVVDMLPTRGQDALHQAYTRWRDDLMKTVETTADVERAEDLTEAQKFAIAYTSGARASYESDERGLNGVVTTEPCAICKMDGKWRVFTQARREPSSPNLY